MRCRRNTLVRAPLFSLIILSARATLPPSLYLCFFISTTLPPALSICSPVSISIFLSFVFCWRCPVRVFNEMPGFEVEWWRWKDAIKNLMFRVNLCKFSSIPSSSSPHTRWREEIQSASKAKALCETVVFEIMLKHTCVLIIVCRYVQCVHYCAEVLSHPWFIYFFYYSVSKETHFLLISWSSSKVFHWTLAGFSPTFSPVFFFIELLNADLRVIKA